MSLESRVKMSNARKGRSPWNKGVHIYLGGKKFEKDNIPWNKGKKGLHLSPKSEWKKGYTPMNSKLIKKGQFVDEAHPQWRGDLVSYSGLHYWISRKLGKPRECTNCGNLEAKKYEWANISGEYRRDLSDWIRLCVSCHRRLDGHSYKAWQTRRLSA